MNKIEFKKWLDSNGISKKVQSDYVSRLKRIEHEIENCDIDEQYRLDRCQSLLKLFSHMGLNDEMNRHTPTSLPIGKYSMNMFSLAIRKYVKYCDETSNS